jgi:hypothetical protein
VACCEVLESEVEGVSVVDRVFLYFAVAIVEKVQSSVSRGYRQPTIHHLSILQITLQSRRNKNKELKEVVINLSPADEQWLETTLSKGRKEGR